jgi:hypothetical protein
MADVIHQIFNVDAYTLSVVAALVGWAVILIALTLRSNMVAAYFLPFLALGAFLTLFACREFLITVVSDRNSNIIIVAGAGVIFGFLIGVGLQRLAYMIIDRAGPVRNSNEIGQERRI